MRRNDWFGQGIKLFVSILVCLSAGAVGGIFTSTSVRSWYPLLVKPGFTPPSWVFGPVWTVLYVLMGISLFFVWKKKKKILSCAGTWWFSAQLVLNVLWSVLFFGVRSPLLGMIDILLLLVTIVVTMLSFWRVSKSAAWLLLPYLLWVSFATILNVAFVVLN